MKRSILLVLSLATALTAVVTLTAASAASSTPVFGLDWSLNGSASAPGGNILRLTDNGPLEAGSAWLSDQRPVTGDFHAQFTFDLHDCLFCRADGMTFAIQDSASGTAALGLTGGSLGYGGIAPSVGVEFDTWQNEFDQDNNHVAILENGDVMTHVGGSANPGFDLYGEPITVWIDYAAGTHHFAVSVATSTTKPPNPLISATVDVGTIVGGSEAYFGLTAGTGGANEVHDVTAFTLNTAPASTLQVTKHVVPAYDRGRFNLQVDGVTRAADVGNNGTTGEVTVSGADHTVSETAGPNTILDPSHYVSQISCSNGAAGHGTSLTVHLDPGSKVVCTITNTRRLRGV